MEKNKSKTKASGKKSSASDNKFKKIMIRVLIGIGILTFMLIMGVVGLIFGALYGYVADTELVNVENMRLNLTSFVYVQDSETGEMVEYEQLYDTENRVWVSGSKIPEHLKNAFVAIEDERFYSHSGIDYKRFIGAAFEYLTKDGNSSYGGSTITQQLIKNITQEDDYSIKRKLQEAYRAYNLEKELSKDEILEYYLNTIYLSQKCNGVASAAMTYFGKDVSELSLAECASIAGITQFPTKYDPLVNPENNKQRQMVILRKMRELGFITQKEYDKAKSEELKFVKKNADEDKNYQSYFVDAAIDQVIEDLMKEYNYTKDYASKILYNGGLKIYLSMDPEIQKAMDNVYNDPSAFQKAAGSLQPQSSMVIMDHNTGQIKALCGGRGAKDGNRTLNRATHTLRQPGSTIKPLSVYAPAVEYGLVTSTTIVNDAPISFGNWKPRNDDRNFAGRITVAAALRGSRNVPAVKICNYTTAQGAFNFVKNNFHIDSVVELRESNGKSFSDIGLAPIALGGLTDGVSVLDMCAAYSAFPNGGKYISPTTYTKVLDSEGKVLLEHKGTEYTAMSETTAETMISMMQGVVTGGTGTSARIPNVRAAGKTGTTSSNNDRWFVGFTPYYTGAVWFGYDRPAPLRGFSPNPAAVAWRKVMTEVHKGLPDKAFLEDEKDGKYNVLICEDSGMRATPACKHLGGKLYQKGKIPTKRCNQHPYAFNKNTLTDGEVPLTEKNEEIEGIVEEGGETDTPADNTEGVVVAPEAPTAPVAPEPQEPVTDSGGIPDGV